jgi:hypothetical protein
MAPDGYQQSISQHNGSTQPSLNAALMQEASLYTRMCKHAGEAAACLRTAVQQAYEATTRAERGKRLSQQLVGVEEEAAAWQAAAELLSTQQRPTEEVTLVRAAAAAAAEEVQNLLHRAEADASASSGLPSKAGLGTAGAGAHNAAAAAEEGAAIAHHMELAARHLHLVQLLCQAVDLVGKDPGVPVHSQYVRVQLLGVQQEQVATTIADALSTSASNCCVPSHKIICLIAAYAQVRTSSAIHITQVMGGKQEVDRLSQVLVAAQAAAAACQQAVQQAQADVEALQRAVQVCPEFGAP